MAKPIASAKPAANSKPSKPAIVLVVRAKFQSCYEVYLSWVGLPFPAMFLYIELKDYAWGCPLALGAAVGHLSKVWNLILPES